MNFGHHLGYPETDQIQKKNLPRFVVPEAIHPHMLVDMMVTETVMIDGKNLFYRHLTQHLTKVKSVG